MIPGDVRSPCASVRCGSKRGGQLRHLRPIPSRQTFQIRFTSAAFTSLPSSTPFTGTHHDDTVALWARVSTLSQQVCSAAQDLSARRQRIFLRLSRLKVNSLFC